MSDRSGRTTQQIKFMLVPSSNYHLYKQESLSLPDFLQKNAGRSAEQWNLQCARSAERRKNAAQRVREDDEEKSDKREGCREKRLEFGR